MGLDAVQALSSRGAGDLAVAGLIPSDAASTGNNGPPSARCSVEGFAACGSTRASLAEAASARTHSCSAGLTTQMQQVWACGRGWREGAREEKRMLVREIRRHRQSMRAQHRAAATTAGSKACRRRTSRRQSHS